MNAQEKIAKLVEALEFYAEPQNYHAIGFIADLPCGDFIEDFKEQDWDALYDRPMPGHLARKTLVNLGYVIIVNGEKNE